MATKYLKSRNQELEIPEKNPFANDKLDRLHIASVLTDIVSFYGQSGCVMALDGMGCRKNHIRENVGTTLEKHRIQNLIF